MKRKLSDNSLRLQLESLTSQWPDAHHHVKQDTEVEDENEVFFQWDELAVEEDDDDKPWLIQGISYADHDHEPDVGELGDREMDTFLEDRDDISMLKENCLDFYELAQRTGCTLIKDTRWKRPRLDSTRTPFCSPTDTSPLFSYGSLQQKAQIPLISDISSWSCCTTQSVMSPSTVSCTLPDVGDSPTLLSTSSTPNTNDKDSTGESQSSQATPNLDTLAKKLSELNLIPRALIQRRYGKTKAVHVNG